MSMPLQKTAKRSSRGELKIVPLRFKDSSVSTVNRDELRDLLERVRKTLPDDSSAIQSESALSR